MFYPFLSDDVIKSPLPFDCSVWVFSYALTFFIYLRFGLNVLFVYFYVWRILASFYYPSFYIFGAQLSYMTARAGMGFIMFYQIVIFVFIFLIRVSVCH